MSVCKLTLALLVLQLGLAKCFSWDIVVVDAAKRLQFYNNGTLTLTEEIPSAVEIYSITYDPVHNRLLFADNHSGIEKIYSFGLSTRNIQHLITRKSGEFLKVAYDPVTQLLFWKEGTDRIYSFSINPASFYKAGDVNLIVKLDHFCKDIAVDSCGGNIYWITDLKIERARFDGSEREVLIDNTVYCRYCLAIDQQTQQMYWTEKLLSYDDQVSIESADLNGKNRRTLYTINNEKQAGSLTLSNNFIYWNGIDQKAIWQLPKKHSQHPTVRKAKSISDSYRFDWDVIAANYTIKEQLNDNQNCETLKRSLIPYGSETECIDLKLCVHGTKVSGESRCECTQGYTGEKCDIFVCQNYCLQGNCSVSAEGLPKCSCSEGYSGERCEVNACHKHCLNNGICSLNEEDEPVCECTADYEGERCDVSTTHTGVQTDNTTQHVLRDLRRQVRQVIKEELKRAQRFLSYKIDEYEVNI